MDLHEHARRIFFYSLTMALLVLCFQPAVSQTDDAAEGESDPIKLFERGQNAHAKGDLTRALALYEAALKLKPEFPEAEYQRGAALVALDKSSEAEQAFARAIELKPDWPLPNSALGNLLARLGRDKEAEPLLRRALKLGAKDSTTLDSLSAIRSRAGDNVEALSLAQAATNDDNASASAWAWRGSIERLTGNTTAALASLEHSLQIDPTYVAALKERAALQTSAGAYGKAIEDLQTALSIKPGDKPLSLQLAHVYGLAGKTEEEQKILNKIGMAQSQNRAPGDFVVGAPKEIEDANSDDPKVAQPALEKLIATNPKNAKLLARLGEITRRGDPQKSADSYRRANEIEPANPRYATGYAAALVQLRRFAEAEIILRRIIAAAPDEYTAHANLALSLYELKRFPEAIHEYEWLAASRPEIAATYFFIATAHDNLGEYEQALDAYEKFLSRANATNNKLEIEKTNLRLPRLREQISRGQGKRKRP